VPKLSGQVKVHGDKAATAATVEVINSTGDVIDQVQVDGDGRYTYHLSAGKWTLNVYDPHGHRGRVEVDLTDDDATHDVDLSEPEGGH
jgi:hypothetical protein